MSKLDDHVLSAECNLKLYILICPNWMIMYCISEVYFETIYNHMSKLYDNILCQRSVIWNQIIICLNLKMNIVDL